MSRLPLLLALFALTACATRSGELPPPPPREFDEPLAVVEQWQQRVGSTPATNSYRLKPAVDAGRVFAAAAEGQVSAFSAEDGERLWRQQFNREFSGGPGVGSGVVVLGTRDGRVLGLNAADGAQLWDVEVSSEVLAPPAVADGVAVVRTGDGRLYGLEAQSGRRLWLYERMPPTLTLRGTSGPVIAGQIALAGLDTGRVAAVNLRDGSPLWEAEVAAPRGRTELERMVDVDGEPAVLRGEAYAASYQGRIVAIGLYTGRTSWGREFSTFRGLAVDTERVYGIDTEARVWAFDRFSGGAAWRQEALRAVRLTAPVAFGDYVLVGDGQGYLNWLSASDGRLLDRTHVGRGEVAEAPLVSGDTVYVLTSGGDLTAFRFAD